MGRFFHTQSGYETCSRPLLFGHLYFYMSHLNCYTFSILIAVAIFAISATNVEASCGDYLSHDKTILKNLVQVTSLFDSSVVAKFGEPENSVPLSPCRNNGCKRAPHVPPAPSTPIVLTLAKGPVGLKSDGCQASLHCQSAPFFAHDALATDRFFISEIDHPPRLQS